MVFRFLSTPYRVVRNRKVTDEIHYLTPAEEEHYKIAQANNIKQVIDASNWDDLKDQKKLTLFCVSTMNTNLFCIIHSQNYHSMIQ